jgi:nucleoside-diphosphate-sugar epimerase
MKNCLVTGGCGFIGSALVKYLHATGDWRVDVVDDLSTGDLENLSNVPQRNLMTEMLTFYQENFESERGDDVVLMITGDFAHPNVFHRIKEKKYDVIFHVAALPRVAYSIEDPIFTTETNLLKTVALFKAAANNVRRVVFSSSSSVYGDIDTFPQVESFIKSPKSPYALQKATCEDFATQFSHFYGLDVVSLRYFNVYGPGQYGDSPYATVVAAWSDALSNSCPLRIDGTGEQSRDFTYISDAVQANVLAAESTRSFTGEAINIAGGKPYSINEVFSMFKDTFGDLTTLSAPPREGDVFKTHADVSRAKELLGFETKVSLKDGLASTWEWWGDQRNENNNS